MFSFRFPDAFVTFSSFKSRFPEVSGYCHCADSQGRELAETGEQPIPRSQNGGTTISRLRDLTSLPGKQK